MRIIKILQALQIISLLCILSLSVCAQSIDEATAKKIDALFKRWDNDKTPGCVVGVLRNDSIIYARGYGMANLEFKVRNSPELLYHMASISKQFTAYSILALASAGKLRLDDEPGKFLSWFPQFKEKITIRNLLNHTSGIRDQWQLLGIAGIRGDDVITEEQLIRILSRQRELNFKPGNEYNYSNSNFFLLGEIIRSVSGKTLRQFTDSAIFKPLGMNDTHFRDASTEVELRAYSYGRVGDRFINMPWNNSSTGATNLYTTVYDLAKWIMNLYQPRQLKKADVDLLTKPGRLNNGSPLTYANGIISSEYKGWRQFSHAGGDAGYGSYMTVFPDLRLGVMIFSNIPGVGGFTKAHQVADLFLKDTTLATNKKIDSSLAIIRDTLAAKRIAGNYIEENGGVLRFSVKDANLIVTSDDWGGDFLLVPIGNNRFRFLDGPFEGEFAFGTTKSKKVLTLTADRDTATYQFYNEHEVYEDAFMNQYTGDYYCPELECRYHIVLNNHHLLLASIRYDNAAISFAGPDHLFIENSPLGHLLITRSKKGVITGFEVNTGRVRHLKFFKPRMDAKDANGR